MPYQNDQLATFVASFFGGGIVGGLVAAYAAYKYGQANDRRTRRIEFLKLLGEWRTKVNRCPSPAKVAADFPQDVARFGGAYIALEPDLWCWKRSKFHALCDEIVAMTDSDVERDMGKLLERIETLITLFN